MLLFFTVRLRDSFPQDTTGLSLVPDCSCLKVPKVDKLFIYTPMYDFKKDYLPKL